jgi:threonine/homoserine/homoserine lactone efflux protein
MDILNSPFNQPGYLWVMTLLPLSISPGPANILFAALGSSFGIRASLPFWLGTNLICILQTLAIGLGYSALITRYPESAIVFQYLGVGVLLYLALRFFLSSLSRGQVSTAPGFVQGIIIQLLNLKYLMIPMVMFSQFYHTQQSSNVRIVQTTALALLTMSSNLIWIIGGRALNRFIAQHYVENYQGIFFGSVLCVTALWLALS